MRQALVRCTGNERTIILPFEFDVYFTFRSLHPLYSTGVYAVSLGDVPADLDAVGVIGARVMAKAIVRAVEAADSAYGFPAARDM